MITYFDFETDGRDPSSCQPIQFAAATFEFPLVGAPRTLEGCTMKPLRSVEMKIQFDLEKADPDALEINNFNVETWEAEAISHKAAVSMIYSFFNRSKTVKQISKKGGSYYVAQLAGHNAASFDFTILLRMFRMYGEFLPVSFNVLDTLHLASWLKYAGMLPGAPQNLKLGTLCDLFEIPIDAHDALGDVVANAELGFRMTELLKGGAYNG